MPYPFKSCTDNTRPIHTSAIFDCAHLRAQTRTRLGAARTTALNSADHERTTTPRKPSRSAEVRA